VGHPSLPDLDHTVDIPIKYTHNTVRPGAKALVLVVKLFQAATSEGIE
jgi:hypothetical protein